MVVGLYGRVAHEQYADDEALEHLNNGLDGVDNNVAEMAPTGDKEEAVRDSKDKAASPLGSLYALAIIGAYMVSGVFRRGRCCCRTSPRCPPDNDWQVVGPALILLNKFILHSLDFPYPMFLSGLGVLVSGVVARYASATASAAHLAPPPTRTHPPTPLLGPLPHPSASHLAPPPTRNHPTSPHVTIR